MNVLKLLAYIAATLLGTHTAFAQSAPEVTCGEPYTVVEGDTLQAIAERAYGQSSDWEMIYYSNLSVGQGGSLVEPGNELSIPCLRSSSGSDADDTTEEVAATRNTRTPIGFSRAYRDKLRLLTADNYRPFADRALPGGGMVTELIDSAMQATGKPYSITWINDWTAHLDPLLTQQFFDMGFPWLKPRCEDDPDQFQCVNFLFSDPLFEMLIVFFVTEETGFEFETDADVEGKRLCRPAGYPVHDLDQDGRNWLTERKVLLLQPQTPRDCFDLLDRGLIDAVVVNEFLGRDTIGDMRLGGKVFALPRAVAAETLHVVISKTHAQATTALYEINEAIQEMEKTGDYQEIVAKHLATFYNDSDGSN